MPFPRSLFFCILASIAVSTALADEPQAHRVGAYTVTFSERSPLSDINAQIKRCQWRPDKPLADYDLSRESFNVFVPEPYKDNEPDHEAAGWGLLVWVDARPQAVLREDWKSVLAEHRLLWVGANNAGNKRDVWQRFGLALDAVHNMNSLYRVDKNRVYVSGLSGGGRSASRLGIYYPKTFRGAIPMVGCDFYQPVPVADQPGKFWPPRFRPPQPTYLLSWAKYQNRFVLLTGETDYNRDSTKAIYEHGYVRQRFRFVQYLEVPDMGHTVAPGPWLAKAITFLDAPLKSGKVKRK